MTIDMGNPGIAGFGYGQGSSSQGNQPPRADNDQSQQQNFPQPPESKPESASAQTLAGNGTTASQATTPADDHAEVAEEVASKPAHEQIPGLETSASDCLNRAAQIARSLNHANLSSDHLMLALTLDQSARRLLERVGNVAQLREAAMHRLGKNHTKFSRDIGDQPLPPTSDLDDLAKAARQAAAEREQSIAISDLINAFPKFDGRLTYAAAETARTVAVIDTIEKGLVPRVDDALTRIEGAIVDAMQRQHQSVRNLLADLNSMQSQEWQRQQREFMDEIRRQVREAADVQVAEALKGLNEKFPDRGAELETEEPPAVVTPTVADAGTAQGWVSTAQEGEAPEKKSGSWSWLTIL